MTGEFTIITSDGTEYDAYSTFGMSLGYGAYAALMTPPSVKDYITSSNRNNDGSVYDYTTIKFAERSLSLQVYIQAKTRTQMNTRLSNFQTRVLAKGKFSIKTAWTRTNVFHLAYKSFEQFSEFNGRMGKFVLRCQEPNPTLRTEE